MSVPASPLLDASRLLDFSHYKELAFFPTLGQSSIYSLTVLPSRQFGNTDSAPCKYDIIAACLLSAIEYSSTKQRCNVYSFISDGGCLKPMNKPNDFVYLPIADIVCIRALYDYTSKEYLTGVGFVKEEGQSFFNIYGADTQENLPECCLCFSELAYVPLQATHSYYISPSTKKPQWAFFLACGSPCHSPTPSGPTNGPPPSPIQVYARLGDCRGCTADLVPEDQPVLSGSPPDQSVADSVSSSGGFKSTESSGSTIFSRQPSHPVNKVYGELDLVSAIFLFPELKCVPASMVTYMDFVMLKTDPPVRLSAFGCIDGWFGVGITDISKPALLHFFSGSHDSPITCVKLFKQFPESSPGHLGSQGETVEPPYSVGKPEEFSLLVCSGFEPAVVYQNVYTCQRFGPDNQAVLHGSADFDHVNCACVGDLDFDGRPEIVIGTFGKQLLLYRWVDEEEKTADPLNADKVLPRGRYECVSRRTVAGPVHSLLYGYDFLGDGCLCLAVLTSQGLQVLQCKSETVMDLLERRLDCLLTDMQP
nr:unnamed protein product [Spirometra erinaceieuropaei]